MIIFNLKNQNYNLLHCQYKNNLFYTDDGILYGNTNIKLPDQWSLLYNFTLYNNFGQNGLLFQFGSFDEKNGFGCYINQNKYITLRINDEYNYFDNIKTKLNKRTKYDISICKYEDIVSFFINNELKFKIKCEINDFNKFGAFNRFSTYGSKNEYTSGILSNVLIYDKYLTFGEKKDIFKDLNKKQFTCLNCGENNFVSQFIKFNHDPRPQDNNFYQNNEMIEYNICQNCGTIFSSQMMNWSTDKFAQRCYNKNYIYYDGAYSNKNADRIIMTKNWITKNFDKNIKHLDYGSGNGFLSQHLIENGYQNSKSFDPFKENADYSLLDDKYDLITAIQVIEHAYNINEIFQLFSKIIKKNGKIMLTTLLYNNEQLQNWWYCSPRVGHILFFTKNGFQQFVEKHGFIVEKYKNIKSSYAIILCKL